jgi:hypothetical protein
MHCSPPLWWAVGFRVLKFGPRISLTAGLQRHPSGWPEPRFQAEQPLGSRIRFSRRQAKAARSIASAVGGLERKKMLRGVFCGRLLNAPYHSSGRPEKRQRGTWSYGCLVRGGILGRWCRSLGGLGSRSRADITRPTVQVSSHSRGITSTWDRLGDGLAFNILAAWRCGNRIVVLECGSSECQERGGLRGRDPATRRCR